MRSSLRWAAVLMTLTVSFMMGGCNQGTAKKPVTPAKKAYTGQAIPNKNTVTRPAKKPLAQTNTIDTRKMADRMTKLAVKEKGVKSATVVIQPTATGRNAMVGLTLAPNVKGTETERIKTAVAKRLQKAEPSVGRVLVTTNPDLVKRIGDMAKGVMAGKPATSFTKEAEELNRRMTPTRK